MGGSLETGSLQIPDPTTSTVTVPVMRANTVLWDRYFEGN